MSPPPGRKHIFLIKSLRILYMSKIHFDYFHPTPLHNSSQIQALPLHSFPVFALFFFNRPFRPIVMSTRVAPVTGHGSPTRDTPLEKADSFSSRSHQLSITLKLGWELVSPSHLHAIVLTGLTLSRSSAGNQNFREFMSVVVWPCFRDTVLLWSFSTYGFYNLLICKGP